MSNLEQPPDSNKSDPTQVEKASSGVLIKNYQLLNGIFACLHNAEHFFKTSKILYEQKNYQSCIPLATISLEESMKGLELLTKFRHNEDLTSEGWSNLKDHKYKLTHSMENAIKEIKSLTGEELSNSKKELERTGMKVPEVTIEKLAENLQNRADVHSQFQDLREGCFYTNWDKFQGKWTLFDELPSHAKDSLAFYVLTETEIDLKFLYISIERYVNRLRETGQLLQSLPYPSYSEYRTPENYESNKLQNQKLSKLDQVKFDQGYQAMQQFVLQGSFQFISYGIFSKSMLRYLKIIRTQDDDKWYPHPMIKAMMMAMSLAKEKNEDGKNVMAVSSDEGVTSDGKPWMVFAVVANMKSGICHIENITDLGNKDYVFHDEIIEKIIRTEIVMERHQGKTIPFSTFIEALSVVGVKVKMIKLTEIEDAIKTAKKMVQSGRVDGVSQTMVDGILSINGAEEWDKLDTIIRCNVASFYGMTKYPGYEQYMTPSDDLLKSRCRQIILFTIQKPFIKTA